MRAGECGVVTTLNSCRRTWTCRPATTRSRTGGIDKSVLADRLRQECHRDHVSDHHVRRQPPGTLLPTPGPVDDLLKEVPIEPGRNTPNPMWSVNRPDGCGNNSGDCGDVTTGNRAGPVVRPQHATLTCTNALPGRHWILAARTSA
jgi:hypothetical protein